VKPKEYKKYELNVTDVCYNKKYSINVSVKESESDEDGEEETNYTWIYIIVGALGLIIIIVVIFFILKTLKRKKNIEKDEGETGLLGKNVSTV